jgi:maleate isomerase
VQEHRLVSERIRIGLIVPATNTTAEPDFVAASPPGVTVHSARLWFENDGLNEEGVDRMNAGVRDAARYLAQAKVDYVIYACTTGSFYKGVGYDLEMMDMMREASGVPALVTAVAGVEALRHLDATRISVASPYNEWQNGRLRAYLEANAFDVLNVEGDPHGAVAGGQGHNDLSPASAIEFASSVCRPEAEALFCSCTAWRTMEVAAALEGRTARPVVTANQATVWMAFRELGIRPNPGYGSLLDGAPA